MSFSNTNNSPQWELLFVGLGLALDILGCVTTGALTHSYRQKGRTSQDDETGFQATAGQGSPRIGSSATTEYTEGLPLLLQLLAVGLCLLGFNAMLADPIGLESQLGDLGQAITWGLVVLMSFQTFELDSPDSRAGDPGHHGQTRPESSGGGSEPLLFPLAHSPSLNVIWIGRSAALWARCSSPLSRLNGGGSLRPHEALWIASAATLSAFAVGVSFMRLSRWIGARAPAAKRGPRSQAGVSSAPVARAPSLDSWASLTVAPEEPQPKVCTLEAAGWLNRLCFAWATPLMEQGARAGLRVADLFLLPRDLEPQECTHRLWRSWCAERRRAAAANRKAEQGGVLAKASVLRACLVTYGGPLTTLGLLKALNCLLSFAGPLILQQLLVLLLDRKEAKARHHFVREAWFLLSTLAAACILKALLNSQCEYHQGRLCAQIRAGLTGCLFRKALCTKAADLGADADGSFDFATPTHVEEVVSLFNFFHELWALPLQIGIGLVLLFQQVHFACLPGILVMLSLVPVNRLLAYRMQGTLPGIKSAREARVRNTTDVVRAIPQIKALALEDFFKRRIVAPRERELSLLAKLKALDAVSVFIRAATSLLVVSCTFGTYTAFGGKMRVDVVFIAFALFGVVVQPINSIPFVVVSWRNALRCVRRLRTLMGNRETSPEWAYRRPRGPHRLPAGEERRVLWAEGDPPEPWQRSPPKHTRAASTPAEGLRAPLIGRGHSINAVSGRLSLSACLAEGSGDEDLSEEEPPLPGELPEGVAVFLQGASFVNPARAEAERRSVVSAEEPQLKELSLSIPRGSLCCVLGDSEACKEDLLQALCGELSCKSGWGVVLGAVSYAPQSPFLLQASMRANVVFGSKFDHVRYTKVLEACALDAEMRLLPQGDLTSATDQSVNPTPSFLARLSLARAVYQDSDVVLVEDILRQVDHLTAERLVSQVVLGPLLEGKTRVIVCNHYQALHAADQLLWVQDGGVVPGGKWSDASQEPAAAAGTGKTSSPLPMTLQKIEADAVHRRELSVQDLVTLAGPSSPAASHAVSDFSGDESEASFGKLMGSSFRVAKSPRVRLERRSVGSTGTREEDDSELGRWAHELVHTSPSTIREGKEPSGSGDESECESERSSGSDTLVTAMPEPEPGAPRALTSLPIDEEHEHAAEPMDKEPVGGRASFAAYLSYAAAASWEWAALALVTVVLTQLGRTGVDLWIARWVSEYHRWAPGPGASKHGLYLEGLLLLALLNAATTAARAAAFARMGLRAARRMHERLLDAMLSMQLSFFTNVPPRNILSRFSADTSVLDDALPSALNAYISHASVLAGMAVVLAITEPWLLVSLVPAAATYAVLQKFYRSSTLRVWRLVSACHAPVQVAYMEALQAGPEIRGNGVQASFQRRLGHAQAELQRAIMSQLATSQWLNLRLQISGAVLVGVVGAVTIADAANYLPWQQDWTAAIGMMGLSLAYILPTADVLSGVLANSMDTEQNMMASERVSEVAGLPTERDLDKAHIASSTPPRLPGRPLRLTPAMVARHNPAWPRHGEVLFENVTVRYDSSFTPALDRLTLSVPAGTKVGIVGRTASGKSSLLGALLRLWPTSGGKIYIDGIDIREIPVKRLRRVVGIVPQQPFLFRGTIRENVDPYQRYRDSHIKQVLETIQLWDILRSLAMSSTSSFFTSGSSSSLGFGIPSAGDTKEPDQTSTVQGSTSDNGNGQQGIRDSVVLSTTIENGGAPLTSGQAQLLSMARIILRAPRIVCLDEATATVDPHSASLMAKAIRTHLGHSTCLQVANRLDDVMNCSSVVVMAAGRIVERGNPEVLLRNPSSQFASLHAYNMRKAQEQLRFQL